MDCKSVYRSSILLLASNKIYNLKYGIPTATLGAKLAGAVDDNLMMSHT